MALEINDEVKVLKEGDHKDKLGVVKRIYPYGNPSVNRVIIRLNDNENNATFFESELEETNP